MRSDRVRLFAMAFVVAAVVVLVDQVTKAAVIAGLSETERIPILGDLLGLQLALTPGRSSPSDPQQPGCSRCLA